MPDISTTQRDSISVSMPTIAPLSVGIGEKGLEIFNSRTTSSGLRVDIGVLAVNSPPGEFMIAKVGRDLNNHAQAYGSQFAGLSVGKNLDGGKSVLGYAGQDLKGGAVSGVRYSTPVSKNATLIADAHISRDMTSAGVFYNWNKTDGEVEQKLRSGLSLRNGEAVASATYAVDKKFTLEGGGYLRGQFGASAAVDKHGHNTSLSVAVLKDVASFNLLDALPVTVEAGIGVQVNNGGKPTAAFVWQFKM